METNFDLLHIKPPKTAPECIKNSTLSIKNRNGLVEVDPQTLQHTNFPNVFAIGDIADLPQISSAAAIFKQAPVVVHNMD